MNIHIVSVLRPLPKGKVKSSVTAIGHGETGLRAGSRQVRSSRCGGSADIRLHRPETVLWFAGCEGWGGDGTEHHRHRVCARRPGQPGARSRTPSVARARDASWFSRDSGCGPPRMQRHRAAASSSHGRWSCGGFVDGPKERPGFRRSTPRTPSGWRRTAVRESDRAGRQPGCNDAGLSESRAHRRESGGDRGRART